MKKIFLNKIAILLCASALSAGMLTSCNNNIDMEAEGIISADGFFKSPDDFEKAMNRLYSRMNLSSYDLWMDATTDNGLTTHSWNNGYEYGHNIATASSSFFKDKWNNGYKDIQWANTIINSIDNCEWSDQAVRNRYLAEAKASRAFTYLNMVGMFGNIMFYTENPTLATADDVEQIDGAAGWKKVFDFVLSELDEAIKALPEKPANKSMWGKPAARLLRARAASYAAGYLNDPSYYQITLSETEALISAQATGKELAGNFSSLFTYGNESLDEVIMVRTYSADSKNSWGNWYNQSIGGYCVTTPVKGLVDAYEYVADRNEKQPYLNKEPRFYETIYTPGMVIRGMYYNTIPNNIIEKGGKYYFDPAKDYGYLSDKEVRYGDVLAEGGEGEWNKTPTGFTWKKYFTESETWNTTNSYIIFRYAEAYLLRAEALAETGNANGAKALIKVIRDRAGNTNDIDAVIGSLYGGQLKNLIRNEFRVELANEGLRFYDIRRWGIFIDAMNVPVEGIEYYDYSGATPVKTVRQIVQRTFTSKEFWWAIPQAEMDLNDRLNQNPGW